MRSNKKSIDQILLLIINVGYACHNSDWNWKDVQSPFYRLYYVTKGHARVIIYDKVYELTPNNMYLIPAFAKHSYECNDIFEHYYIHIYEDIQSTSSFMEDFIFPFEIPAKDVDLHLFKRLCEINPMMKLPQSNPVFYDNNSILEQNIVKNKQRLLYYRVESRGILYILLARFLKEGKLRLETENMGVRKCLAYIRKNIDKNINIDTLVELACVSKDHMIRLFKKETGFTPVQYIINKRIERAQLLLVSSNKSIKEIAYMLSYEDYSYFTRLFKKATGMSPIKYRRIKRRI